jgi:hypothetical protein
MLARAFSAVSPSVERRGWKEIQLAVRPSPKSAPSTGLPATWRVEILTLTAIRRPQFAPLNAISHPGWALTSSFGTHRFLTFNGSDSLCEPAPVARIDLQNLARRRQSPPAMINKGNPEPDSTRTASKRAWAQFDSAARDRVDVLNRARQR